MLTKCVYKNSYNKEKAGFRILQSLKIHKSVIEELNVIFVFQTKCLNCILNRLNLL